VILGDKLRSCSKCHCQAANDHNKCRGNALNNYTYFLYATAVFIPIITIYKKRNIVFFIKDVATWQKKLRLAVLKTDLDPFSFYSLFPNKIFLGIFKSFEIKLNEYL